jgi:Mismatch repair ATPase (MutS family)
MEESKLSLISFYYDMSNKSRSLLSDNEFEDLDLNEFFSAVDFTSSCVGQQYLYSILRHGGLSGIDKYETLINELTRNKILRKKLVDILAKLKNTDAYNIASLLSENIPNPSSHKLLLLSICRFLPFLFAGITLLTHGLVWLILFIITFISNLILHYASKKNIYQYYFSIPQLVRLLKQMDSLVKERQILFINEEIVQTLDELKILRKRLKVFNMGIRLESDLAILAYLISELRSIFFLTEAYTINKALCLLNGKRKKISDIFCFWGILDTLCSISFLREQLPYYCLPSEVIKGERLHAVEVYHPLIPNAVSNSIVVQTKSVLITGSNMSGKTSFIRTIGINLLSGKVLHTCFARDFAISSKVNILSAIHLTDDLLGGKSYFLSEVDAIKRMIDSVSAASSLFLLDEPFKGTNTKERVAISKAVLSALAKENNIVFVSTHDIELSRLLESDYDLYHFTESVRDGRLTFDYKLKAGVTSERNAIKILEICHYPDDIIRDAYDIVDQLEYK